MSCQHGDSDLILVTTHDMPCSGPPCACNRIHEVCRACLLEAAPGVRSEKVTREYYGLVLVSDPCAMRLANQRTYLRRAAAL